MYAGQLERQFPGMQASLKPYLFQTRTRLQLTSSASLETFPGLERRNFLLLGAGLLSHRFMSAHAAPALQYARLSTGDQIPSVGLGVFLSKPGKATYKAVQDALACGYRHIDTAQLYDNEADVGQQNPSKRQLPGERCTCMQLIMNGCHSPFRQSSAR